jgi:hypothetical protein
MRALGTGALCLVLLGTAQAPPLTMTPLKALSATLPSGEGKILFYKYCVMCHGAELIGKRLEDRRGWIFRYWEDLVFEMIDQWGAPISREEVDPIARYLMQNFGLPGEQPSLEALLPAGDQRQMILQRCTPCHDPGITIQLRVDLPATAWKKLLQRMRTYGAPLSPDEVESLSLFLSQNLTSDGETAQKNPVRQLDALLPDRPGKDLTLVACLSCHGPSEFKKRLEQHSREEPYYWRRVVHRMREQWEAPLQEPEVDLLVDYLSSHFTRQ